MRDIYVFCAFMVSLAAFLVTWAVFPSSDGSGADNTTIGLAVGGLVFMMILGAIKKTLPEATASAQQTLRKWGTVLSVGFMIAWAAQRYPYTPPWALLKWSWHHLSIPVGMFVVFFALTQKNRLVSSESHGQVPFYSFSIALGVLLVLCGAGAGNVINARWPTSEKVVLSGPITDLDTPAPRAKKTPSYHLTLRDTATQQLVTVTISEAESQNLRIGDAFKVEMQIGYLGIPFRWSTDAALRNRPEEQNRLGEAIASGTGVGKNVGHAIELYRKAANQGFARAQFNLGSAYANGTGVAKNEVDAAGWFQKAAEQGNAPAQYSLGAAYQTGTGVAQNQEEALKWYRKAAEQGLAPAQVSLGDSYTAGSLGVKDEAEALKWYRKAAIQGVPKAETNVGLAFANGTGTDKNEVEAVKWYRKAADQGSPQAQWLLGQAYETGRGVTKDDVEACKWYELGAARGSAEAKVALAELKTKLTPAQMAEGKKRSLHFKERESTGKSKDGK